MVLLQHTGRSQTFLWRNNILEGNLPGVGAGGKTRVHQVGLPALLPERPEVPRVGLHQEALPAEVPFQVERVAQLLPVVSAGLHEHSAALEGERRLVGRNGMNVMIFFYRMGDD